MDALTPVLAYVGVGLIQTGVLTGIFYRLGGLNARVAALEATKKGEAA